jgi:hypothetical protein
MKELTNPIYRGIITMFIWFIMMVLVNLIDLKENKKKWKKELLKKLLY